MKLLSKKKSVCVCVLCMCDAPQPVHLIGTLVTYRPSSPSTAATIALPDAELEATAASRASGGTGPLLDAKDP